MLRSEPTPQPDTPKGSSTFKQMLNHAQVAAANPFTHGLPDWTGALCRVHDAVDAAACIARSNFHEPSASTVLEIARMVLAELGRSAPGGVCK